MITLSTIVQQVMLEDSYKRCNKALAFEYALDAYRGQTRNLFYSKVSRTYKVENFRVPFPPSYLKWTKIGVCEGKHIALLSIDETMCKTDKVCNCSEPEVTENQDGCETCNSCAGVYGGWFSNGGWYGRAFGASVVENRFGYFSIDQENQVFLFNSDLEGKDIIIEYITLDTTMGVNTEVDTFLKPILAHKIRIALESQKVNPDIRKIQMLEQQTVKLENDQILYSQSWSFNELFKSSKAGFTMMKG